MEEPTAGSEGCKVVERDANQKQLDRTSGGKERYGPLVPEIQSGAESTRKKRDHARDQCDCEESSIKLDAGQAKVKEGKRRIMPFPRRRNKGDKQSCYC